MILAITDLQTGEWILTMFAALGGVLVVLKIIEFFRAKPPQHKQFADRDDTERRFGLLERKIESVRIEQRTQYDDLMRAGEHRKEEIFIRINNIHDDINNRISEIGMEQSNAIGELRGELRRMK